MRNSLGIIPIKIDISDLVQDGLTPNTSDDITRFIKECKKAYDDGKIIWLELINGTQSFKGIISLFDYATNFYLSIGGASGNIGVTIVFDINYTTNQLVIDYNEV